MTTKDSTADCEKDFSELVGGFYQGETAFIKDFIHHTLEVHTQRIREKIEGMRKNPLGTDQFGEVYRAGTDEMKFNETLDAVLSILDTIE
jgi:hypothetical protein